MFKEQGSSASQMTAAKVMDDIARLPECARPVTDVSALHPSTNENTPKSLNFPKWESPDITICLHDRNGQNHGRTSKIRWFLLNELCTPFSRIFVEKTI